MKAISRTWYIVEKKRLTFTLVMLAFMEPPLFSQLAFIDNLYLMFKSVAGVYALYYSVIRYKHFSAIQISATLFFWSLVLSTAINHGDIFQAFRTIAFNWIACVYLDTSFRKDSEMTINLLRKICVVYIAINGILLIVFPGGFGKYVPGYSMTVDSRLNFLGRDNAFIYFFIFALIIELFYSKKKQQSYTVMATIIITMLYVWSGTGLIGCLIIVAFALVIQGRKIEKAFSIWTISIAYLIIYLGVVVFRIQDVFSGLIVNVLHKDITFTGRTYLWDMAMAYIIEKPYWGYGITEKFLTMKSGISYSPHNLILQILLTGGFLSLGLFLILYCVSARKLVRKHYTFSSLISVAFFAYLIASLTEATMNTQYLYFLFVIAYNIGTIEENRNAQRGKEGELLL